MSLMTAITTFAAAVIPARRGESAAEPGSLTAQAIAARGTSPHQAVEGDPSLHAKGHAPRHGPEAPDAAPLKRQLFEAIHDQVEALKTALAEFTACSRELSDKLPTPATMRRHRDALRAEASSDPAKTAELNERISALPRLAIENGKAMDRLLGARWREAVSEPLGEFLRAARSEIERMKTAARKQEAAFFEKHGLGWEPTAITRRVGRLESELGVLLAKTGFDGRRGSHHAAATIRNWLLS